MVNRSYPACLLAASLSGLALPAQSGPASGQASGKGDSGKETDPRVVTVLRDSDCGSDAITQVKDVAKRLGVEVTIEEVIVETEEQAKALSWPGSPTVRVKGLDIDHKARGKTSYAMT